MAAMQIQDALLGFLVQLEADGRSRHTIGQYRRHVSALATWLATNDNTSITTLTPETVARFFADDAAKKSCRGGPKRAVTLNAMRTSIRCFAKHLHDSGLVATNPARLLRRARCAAPPPKALHPDEQQRLREVLATATGPAALRDRMLIELLLGTGVRIGSALALDVPDIDLTHGEVALRTTKNDRPATAVLPALVAANLRAFLGDRREGPVFMTGERRVSMRHTQRRLAAWLHKAGIRGRSAHSLRHSFAMKVYSSTGDLLLTQAALGHASVASTTCYAKVDRARVRAVVGA